jgi:hypothetical protein
MDWYRVVLKTPQGWVVIGRYKAVDAEDARRQADREIHMEANLCE